MPSQLLACECGRKLRVEERHAGKTVLCPACGRSFNVPAAPREDTFTVLPEETAPTPAPRRGEDERPRARPKPRRFQRPRRSGLHNLFANLSYYLQGRHATGLLAAVVVGGIALVVIAFVEGRLMGVASDKPQSMTLAQLADKGPGDNAHVLVTDYFPGNNFVYSQRTVSGMPTGNWTAVFIPVVPRTSNLIQGFGGEVKIPADKIRVIVHSTGIHGDADLARFFGKPTIQGTVVNSIRSLDGETQRLLREAYPGADFGSCYILQEGRKPSSAVFVLGLALLGMLLFVFGCLLFLVRLLFRP